jgi:NAD(P)-dependent dehydrogenase (short-subunit alcohol dehydrogenase family)
MFVLFSLMFQETSKRSGYGVRFNTICPDFAKTDILNCLDSTATLGQFAHLADPTRKFVEQHGLLE